LNLGVRKPLPAVRKAPPRPLVSPAAAPSSISSLTRPKYMPYGDVARVLGTVAVVVGHCCDMVQYQFKDLSQLNHWVPQFNFAMCNFFNSASRWAVPLYVMLSGSLLLDPARAETATEFYKKRLARLGIAIVFWSIFFIALTVFYLQPHGLYTNTNVWHELLLGKPYAHLHFIFRIAGLYAFVPMFRIFLQHAPKRVVTLAVVLCLGLSCLNSVADGFTETEESAFIRFVPFIGYYLAGYLLRDRKVSKRTLMGCWLLAIACVFLLAGGTQLLVETFGNAKLYPSKSYLLYDFVSPVRIALGISVWLIFVNTFDEKWLQTRLSKFISRWLAPATLGIYLVHPLFREIFYVNGWDVSLTRIFPGAFTGPYVLLGIPLVSTMVYLPSVIFTLIVMRIPYVQRIVM